jgi:multidrug efflux pump subunit AcrA (membrane-fusion protein)
MSFLVWTAALTRAADGWDDQAEALSQAQSSLNKVDAELLGSRVSGAAAAFVETWRTEIRDRIAEAQAHADALRASAGSYQRADESAVDSLQRLLPWSDRTLEPGPLSPLAPSALPSAKVPR